LTAEDYEDDIAKDPRIDTLRDKMHCVEDPQITLDYHDPSKRTIGNGLTVTLNDGTKLDEVFIDIPVGHKFRREEVYIIYNGGLTAGETIVAS
jgi:2-methylcitrate dehydratase